MESSLYSTSSTQQGTMSNILNMENSLFWNNPHAHPPKLYKNSNKRHLDSVLEGSILPSTRRSRSRVYRKGSKSVLRSRKGNISRNSELSTSANLIKHRYSKSLNRSIGSRNSRNSRNGRIKSQAEGFRSSSIYQSAL
jgi:hypothetical protein